MARILIVDDEAGVRSTLRSMLERRGYEVVEAADGDECLKVLAQQGADLVLLDILMPRREGLETLLQLRNQGHGPPVIAMSGGGAIATSVLLKSASVLGACEALDKPIRAEALVAAVERSLAGPRAPGAPDGSLGAQDVA